MWLAQQFNSFLDLGICKEYPNMARTKSTSGKSNRPDKEQINQPGAFPAETSSVVSGGAAEAAASRVQPETKRAPETKSAPETRRFELTKAEPRKNVVPINLEDEIRRRAYELYQQREPGSGSESEDWLVAEREVLQRYHQHSA
jgi:hypothetical protein